MCYREYKLNLSCVVVTHNSSNSIKQLVDSLLNQSLQPTSIIVVDNASKDDTVAILKNHSELSHVLNIYSLPFNTGGAGGFRTGIDLAVDRNPDYVITFDDDVSVIDTSYLEKLVSFIESKQLDIVSSLVVDADDHRYTSFCYRLPSGRSNDVQEILKISEPINDVKFFNGAIFSINSLRKLKGPRPEFFIRGDEQEFRMRVLKSQYKVGVAKEAIIYHPSAVQDYVVFRGHKLTIIDHLGKQYFSIRNQFYLYSRAYGHSHSPIKIIRILFKSLYRYCAYYLNKRDYIGLYIWLRAFTDGVLGHLDSAYSQRIKTKYFS